MTSLLPTDCQGDTKDSCDDISSYECYDNKVRHDCCQTCEDHVVSPVVPGCEFGDHVDQCDVDNGRRCYNNDVHRDCCHTCESYKTSDPGCRFGDKVEGCKQHECDMYSPIRRADCCATCVRDTVTQESLSTLTWSTRWHSITTNPATERPVTSMTSDVTVTSASSGVPGWFVPVGASVGGALVLIIVLVVVVLMCRRNRKSDHLSPINDKMYNDYKMSKRAPMPPPRHPSTEKGWVAETDEGSEYAYISPDCVGVPPTKERRTANDPLPPTPGEYLDLSDAKTVSYGYNHGEYLQPERPNHVRVPSNKYDQFPGSHPEINRPENGDVSQKL